MICSGLFVSWCDVTEQVINLLLLFLKMHFIGALVMKSKLRLCMLSFRPKHIWKRELCGLHLPPN